MLRCRLHSLSLDPAVGANSIQIYCNLFRTIDGRENRKYCYSSSSIDLSEKNAILANQVNERLVRSISDRFHSGSLSLAVLFTGINSSPSVDEVAAWIAGEVPGLAADPPATKMKRLSVLVTKTCAD